MNFRSIGKFAAASLLLAVVALSNARSDELLSERAFTDRYVEQLVERAPTLEVSIVEPLQVQIDGDDGQNVFLSNAYTVYRNDAAALDEILARYVETIVESINEPERELTSTNLMPVVKDDQWVAEITATLRERGADPSAVDYYSEPLADGLVVLYAIDSPSSIRYVPRSEIVASKLVLSELRTVARDNLEPLLKDLELASGDGLYALFADGNYEASLLLVDALWTQDQFPVAGEIVVAVPARGVLLVSGTEEKRGLDALEKLTDQSYVESPYNLTRNFYRRAGDSWELWRQR